MEKATLENHKADIMIVDDVTINLHLLTQILETHGYQVHAFPNGPLALAATQTSAPDLIILDVMMPGMDGFALCSHLKENASTHDIPIIFVSALGGTTDKMKAFAAGGVDYITKPFHAGEVIARVETHLALRKLQKQLETQNADLRDLLKERQQVSDTMLRYTTRLETMHEIDRSILAARSSNVVAVAIIGRLRQLIPYQSVAVLRCDVAGQVELLAAESIGKLPVRTDTSTYQTLIMENREQIHGVEDLDARTARTPAQAALHDQGVRAYVVVPMLAHGDMIGALYLGAETPHTFTEDHINIARDVALLIALAIRQARLYEQAQLELEARKQAEAALRQYAEELEASNAELDAFAHTVAHDLKNPLTSLIMHSAYLESHFETLPPEQCRAFLATITRSGFLMNNIIQELLLLANIRKVEDIHIQELDMGTIIRGARERLAQLSGENHVDFVVPKAWPRALGRPQWVEEIWTNYISNAIKYGGQPPRVELGWTQTDDARLGPAYRFWVRDNGAGLTPQEQTRLFTPFTRLSQVRTEGHGLGLSIVQRIAERLGGEVGVDSGPGPGCTFWFTLPGAQVQSQLEDQV